MCYIWTAVAKHFFFFLQKILHSNSCLIHLNLKLLCMEYEYKFRFAYTPNTIYDTRQNHGRQGIGLLPQGRPDNIMVIGKIIFLLSKICKPYNLLSNIR